MSGRDDQQPKPVPKRCPRWRCRATNLAATQNIIWCRSCHWTEIR